MVHPSSMEPDCLLRECEVRFTRRSGPGGQNRNKVETAAILKHLPTGLSSEANERRGQMENRAVALFRLRLRLALEVRCPVEAGHPPSALWRSRCRERRILVNPGHEDFPALLAEALDRIAALKWDVSAAAGTLNCSGSQLLKLLRQESRALQLVNQERESRGLRPLC